MLNKKGVLFYVIGFLRAVPILVALLCIARIPSVGAFEDVSVILSDSEGAPITDAMDLRVSLWDGYDYRSSDLNPDGSINTSSLHYGQYQTTFTITPDENGYFVPVTYGLYRIRISELPDFPVISPFSAYLQLEYKLLGAADTAYQVYDFLDDPPLQNVTRLLIDENSNYYVFDAGPRTYWNTFTLDVNNNAPTNVTLQFGETLGKKLSFNKSTDVFDLNDDLNITGGLTTSDTLTANGAVVLGDNGDTVVINSSVWDISAGGVVSGLTGIASGGTINFQSASVGIGTDTPQSAFHVADGYYAQFSQHQLGSPPTEDCDSDDELGRLSIDTQNNRLYLCNGASRGWDYIPLNDFPLL